MIDIICPYCYNRVNGNLTAEKRITLMPENTRALEREYRGMCEDCDVCLTLSVIAHYEDWD